MGNLDISNLTARDPWATSSSSHTDINRLRQGKVGAQVKKNNITLIYYAFVYQLIIYLHKFWSAYVSCSTQYKDAIQKTWEQIDVVHRMVEANPTTFEFVTSAQGYKKI